MIAQNINRLGLYVDGIAEEPVGSNYFDIYNPSTGEVIAQAPDCTNDEVDLAVASAKRAFATWPETPARARFTCCGIRAMSR